MMITEEMREAAKSKGRELAGDQTGALVEAFAEVAEAGAVAALAAAPVGKVKVRDLVWEVDADRPSVLYAATPAGRYFIYRMTGYRHEVSGPCGFSGVFKRQDEAKAAVKAHFEAAILSAIEEN